MAQYINVTSAAPDFDVAIVGAMPLVDIIGHFDHPAVEPKSSKLFGAAFVHIGFDLELHAVLVIAATRSLAPTGEAVLFGLKAQDPRFLPDEPESPPGCSDRIATGPSAVLHR